MQRIKSVNELTELRNSILEEREEGKPRVIVSTRATCCRLKGSEEVTEALKKELDERGWTEKVEIVTTGCLGFCQMEPIIVIQPKGILYPGVEVTSVGEIVEKSIMGDEVVNDKVYEDPATDKRFPLEKDIPFYSKQKRLVLGDNGNIDPTSLKDYIAIDGYGTLAKVLTSMSPEEVIEDVKTSGLRGRGGAGFPTGIKWDITRKAEGDVKYIICNADEGDPGAYMDRSILESNPHMLLEGMMIGAYAIGSNEGWIYVRNEYPLAIEHLTLALEKLKKTGILGENILGTGFNFDIRIAKGAGAFVCGEETALMASIEGKRGVPNQKPPFPSQYGLFGKPSNINNVETLATVPLILKEGGEWFAGIGTEKSKGTKIFSLVGKVVNTGLVEVPMGTSINEVVFDIGGGAPDGKEVKGIQIGGPSGGCIPREMFHLSIDYESLTSAGAIMGSGGLIVMDETTCMVDVAKYFTNFLQEESCGKCSTCREGTQRMYEVLKRITEGKGTEEDLDNLAELGSVIKDASMCGLGQTAPNPVLSTLRHFKKEYYAHIREKRCPALVCKDLIKFGIDPENCTGCGLCKKNCPQEAISGEKKEPHEIDGALCIKCGVCFDLCKFDAVIRTSGGN
jgi:NADH-quinone oxidoreductase subunit F